MTPLRQALQPFYVVHLRDTVSGATRAYRAEQIDPCGRYEYDEDTLLSHWFDSDFACDCNRSLFLYDGAEEYALPCGDGQIVVDRIERPDGSVLYFADGELATDAKGPV